MTISCVHIHFITYTLHAYYIHITLCYIALHTISPYLKILMHQSQITSFNSIFDHKVKSKSNKRSKREHCIINSFSSYYIAILHLCYSLILTTHYYYYGLTQYFMLWPLSTANKRERARHKVHTRCLQLVNEYIKLNSKSESSMHS